MNSQFFVSCLESRMEDETNWYSRFELGPFLQGQALTVANSLRRTLLAQQKGIFLIAVEIEGAVHEYSRLEAVKESILDILLNLRQISFIVKDENDFPDKQETLLGYFDIQGPGVVKASDLKLPKNIECINPNHCIATLTRNVSFQGRFLILLNSNFNFKANSIGDPLTFSPELFRQEINGKLPNTNWLYINPSFSPIQRVNYVVQANSNILLDKEIIILELWTNGTIHPKKAIQKSCFELAQLFSGLSVFNEDSLKISSILNRFKSIKTEITEEKGTFRELKEKIVFSSGQNENNFQEKFVDRVSSILDLDIANLNLSLQLYLTLKKLNIQNIGNLIQYKKEELKHVSNFSSDNITQVENSLKIFGLALN
uniref:DNA-directed RNA polymerase n=1 Tax=Pedinomonas tuberculata TaxID=160064 RepID=A0A097KL85_9CHLO|nr:alpha subunit of RNA polymerase [Pedinomonas tuberculata]AIT93928.1 alpha subunit of RNA polymerase [Pedinomonas tuberculata]